MSRATITIETIVANDLAIRTAGEHRVLDVSLPHRLSRKNDQGGYDKVGPTTWFEATFWDDHADLMLRTIEKNSLVTVAGYPEIETYTRRDGTPGAKILIKSPHLSVVVRKPRPNAEPVQPADDTWNPPDGYTPIPNSETPF